MPPPSRILCLAPREASASTALRHAVRLACALGATLHAVPRGTVPADVLRRAAHEVASSGCRDALDLRVEAPPPGPEALVETLRAYVQDRAVDLVVTATPADRGAIPPFADPQTQALMKELPCSVLVAGEIASPPPRRLLVPTDLSAATRAPLTCARALAPVYDASIELLHVIETVPYVALTRVDRLSLSGPSFPEHRARRRLDAFLSEGTDAPVSVEPHVAYGDPVDQIGRFVRRHGVDLMVLPPRSAHTPTQSALGAVADRVLRRVACPVLLVRPGPSS
jgi:nucleotide-binding universal stress UspA family protein